MDMETINTTDFTHGQDLYARVAADPYGIIEEQLWRCHLRANTLQSPLFLGSRGLVPSLGDLPHERTPDTVGALHAVRSDAVYACLRGQRAKINEIRMRMILISLLTVELRLWYTRGLRAESRRCSAYRREESTPLRMERSATFARRRGIGTVTVCWT